MNAEYNLHSTRLQNFDPQINASCAFHVNLWVCIYCMSHCTYSGCCSYVHPWICFYIPCRMRTHWLYVIEQQHAYLIVWQITDKTAELFCLLLKVRSLKIAYFRRALTTDTATIDASKASQPDRHWGVWLRLHRCELKTPSTDGSICVHCLSSAQVFLFIIENSLVVRIFIDRNGGNAISTAKGIVQDRKER